MKSDKPNLQRTISDIINEVGEAQAEMSGDYITIHVTLTFEELHALTRTLPVLQPSY